MSEVIRCEPCIWLLCNNSEAVVQNHPWFSLYLAVRHCETVMLCIETWL